jgi:hypothetical protein
MTEQNIGAMEMARRKAEQFRQQWDNKKLESHNKDDRMEQRRRSAIHQTRITTIHRPRYGEPP